MKTMKKITMVVTTMAAVGLALTACGPKDEITLIKSEITSELGQNLSDKASDYVTGDKDVLSECQVDTSKVDITNIGTYELAITHEKEVETMKVKVEDTTAPVLTMADSIVVFAGTPANVNDYITGITELSGKTTLSLADHTYVEEAGTEGVADTENAASTEAVTESTETESTENVVSNDVYFLYEEVGEYDNTITATDASGNKTEVAMHVTVTALPSIIGAKDITAEEGTTIDYLKGVTAADAFGNDLTASITVSSSNVDTSKAGSYTAIYEVVDANGYSNTVTINVEITAKKVAANTTGNGNSGSNKTNGSTSGNQGTNEPSGGSTGASGNTGDTGSTTTVPGPSNDDDTNRWYNALTEEEKYWANIVAGNVPAPNPNAHDVLGEFVNNSGSHVRVYSDGSFDMW